MNYGMILYILGWILNFEAAFLTLPCLVAVLYQEQDGFSFLGVAVLCLVIGLIFSHKKPANTSLYAREGFVIVSAGWIVMSAFGALPFVLNGDIPSYVDALFETISGFTTTGASILADVEALSKASLFWRSFTHWIGGMGVFVFILAILPLVGGFNMNLMKAESPGPSVGKLVPRVRNTAMILYGIYFIITVVEFVLLVAAGMTAFDAITHTFGTVGTGGFGTHSDSLAGFSPAIQNIVTVFMILSGVNFGAYFLIIHKKPRQVLKMEEVRMYLGIILASALLIAFNVRDMFGSWGETLRHAFFQVGSIITTTGFATVDFDLWPQFSKTILIILMFVGACAGSTGGGIKVSRITILLKTIKKELRMISHPRSVKKIAMDGHRIEHEVVRSTNVFIAVYFLVFFTSVLLLGMDELDFTTNFTAVAATLNNIGPGLELVGPTQNFSIFSAPAKFVLMFDMLAGRLELFPMLLLFAPSSWKKY
ncbi:TrkH family potassium uptake protein [Lactonifactor longoviformis]|uniref:Trk system potassium uptake protein TrkH n=1 Tax=Lactonifactor longoviformis DSM 17459 TaxID=1122155 RepID=A0A1M4UFF4_9CLOT|nr:TrkH family potassium uptake protein [Lactonifactor longoviformis]POP32153.1 TrkH family potassium uptake protein [Lactonifactor longoviformis]SHE55499.1 trk system potassium uptake protein TrkH [Lactonifactor longoviformis DSM 17459]